MIHLRFLGHIKTSIGSEEMDMARDSMTLEELFQLLRAKPTKLDHGFTKYNTLVVINDEEALSASAQKDRRICDGDSVLLVPFSHGG